MVIMLWIVAIGLLVVAGANIFMRSDPARLADRIKGSRPAAINSGDDFLALIRRAVASIGTAGAFLQRMTARSRMRPSLVPGKRSMVRTAALEMELDHDSGKLEGLVLAGSHDGKILGSLGLADLVHLYGELRSDLDSCRLLETYLDGRFPVWRNHVQANRNERLSVAPRTGAMTKEEAYKILGLDAGAAAADVRKAHRRLMQRLNPDVGNTSFLAARIDEAKNVLLSDHH